MLKMASRVDGAALLIALAASIAWGAVGIGQSEKNVIEAVPLANPAVGPEAPKLSDTQRLQLQVVAQRIEIAQLKAQAAQVEFERARVDFGALVKSLQVDGYDLDLQRLEYVKKPPAEKPPADKPKE
jgi:hypothetical protein